MTSNLALAQSSIAQQTEDWLVLAVQLREGATRMSMPGFSEKMIRAAEDLEKLVAERGL